MAGITFTLARSVLGAVLGMFFFGYNTGVVNAPEAAIKKFVNESYSSHYGSGLESGQVDAVFTIITSAFIVGGMAGAMAGGRLADRLGRKRGLLASQLVGVVGGLAMALAAPLLSWELLLVGRLVVGLTAGLNTVLAPLYTAEIAPVALRGGLGVLNQLAVTSGIFVGQVLGLGQLLGGEAGWPWLLALALVPAVLQLLLLATAPRSPRHLAISLGEHQLARLELLKLRGQQQVEEVDAELEEMAAEVAGAGKVEQLSILQLLASSELRVALVLCVVLHLSQQLSGMVAIFYYAVSFFKSAGISEENAGFANLGVGAIMVTMTLVTVPLMDRLGRRVLHLSGLVGMFVMALLIVVAQNLINQDDSDNSGSGGFLIAATLGFVVFFAVGPGSIPWMIAGEMFTQGPRPAASSLVVFVNWAANLAVGLLFPLVLIPQLGAFTFLPFAVLLGCFSVFVYFCLPETKGKTVGETSALLSEHGWRNRKYS